MKFGPGFVFTFFYYFVFTTIITTLVAANATDMVLASGLPQQIGVVLGLVAGGIGGYCNQTTSFSVISANPTRLLTQLKHLLEDMDYCLSETVEVNDSPVQPETRDQSQTILCYQRSGVRSLLSGKVFLCVGEKDITVATRALQLKRIQRQLDNP